MLKAIPYVVKLHMYKNVDYRVNRVAQFCQTNACPQRTTYSQVQERDPCKQPEPCPPPPKDDRAFWGAMAILFTAGCFGVYAKSDSELSYRSRSPSPQPKKKSIKDNKKRRERSLSQEPVRVISAASSRKAEPVGLPKRKKTTARHTPEVRDWLSIHAPWYDDLIAIVYEENKTYAEHAKDLVEVVRQFLDPPEPRKWCTPDGRPIKPPKKKEPIEIICPKKIEAEGPPDPKSCLEVTKPPSLKTICDIEKCLLNRGEQCVNNYWTAKEACRYYNELVEENLTNFTYERLKALRPAMDERFKMLNEHVCVAVKALNTLEELGRLLDCGLSAPKEAIANTNAMFKEFMAKIKVMQTEYVWEADRSVSLDKKWQQVEKIVDQYIYENQIMFPGTVYDSEKPSIIGGTDLLLIHTLRYKNMLESVLKERSQAASERAHRGVGTLPQKDAKARDLAIQYEFRKRQAVLDQWYKKKLDWQKAEVDKALKKAVKEMKERHDRNLEINLKATEEMAIKKLNKLVHEAVEAQKALFARELRDLSLKVKGVEAKLEARLKAEREAKRSQQLWTAGASLLAATKKGEPHICVAKEIKAIEAAAGDGDKLVLTVLKSIPEQVRKEGVVPESVLRERYHVMEQTARSVALVELEGSPMPVYIMSWVQSLLLFMRLSGIPQKDIDKPFKEEKDLEDLDTFDRLNYARYWIEQGSLAPALRYVDSLQGASRVAADSWYKDAKSHLEIRQAAEAVIAHATALALQYV